MKRLEHFVKQTSDINRFRQLSLIFASNVANGLQFYKNSTIACFQIKTRKFKHPVDEARIILRLPDVCFEKYIDRLRK